MLAAASILEPGRPLAFVHPIVRTGIYTELSSGERSQGHRGAAQLFAAQPGANELVAEHLLVSDPAGDAWVVERLVEAAGPPRAVARRSRPPCTCVVRWPSRRDRSCSPTCCSSWAWQRRAPACRTGRAICRRRSMLRRTRPAAQRRRWCSRSRSAAPASRRGGRGARPCAAGAGRASFGARAPARGRGRGCRHERRRHGAHRGGAPPGPARARDEGPVGASRSCWPCPPSSPC